MMTFVCNCGAAYARVDHLLDHLAIAHREHKYAAPPDDYAEPCTSCRTDYGARQSGHRKPFRDRLGRCAACNAAHRIAA